MPLWLDINKKYCLPGAINVGSAIRELSRIITLKLPVSGEFIRDNGGFPQVQTNMFN